MSETPADYEVQREKDFRWFIENLPVFYQMFGECYIAIKDREILGRYKSYQEGVVETSKKYPLGTFIVQYCGSNESAYRAFINDNL